MPDYEIQRERIVDRPVTERVVEREVPVSRRTITETRTGGRPGYGFVGNPAGLIIVAAVSILLLLLILGALT